MSSNSGSVTTFPLKFSFVSQFGDVVTASELLQVPVPKPEVISGVGQVDRVETLPVQLVEVEADERDEEAEEWREQDRQRERLALEVGEQEHGAGRQGSYEDGRDSSHHRRLCIGCRGVFTCGR